MVIIQLGCSDMNLNVYIKRLPPLMIKYFILFPSVSRDIHLHQSHPFFYRPRSTFSWNLCDSPPPPPRTNRILTSVPPRKLARTSPPGRTFIKGEKRISREEVIKVSFHVGLEPIPKEVGRAEERGVKERECPGYEFHEGRSKVRERKRERERSAKTR